MTPMSDASWIPKGPGRPRKNVAARNVLELTLADRGLTRQQALRFRRIAEIPGDEFDRILSLGGPAEIEAGLRPWIRGKDPRRTVHLPRVVVDVLTRVAEARGVSVPALICTGMAAYLGIDRERGR